MPDVVCDKFLNLILPRSFQIIVVDIFDLVHKALHILNKDIIACDKHTLLSPATAGRTRLAIRVGRRLGGLLRLGGGGCATCRHSAILDS